VSSVETILRKYLKRMILADYSNYCLVVSKQKRNRKDCVLIIKIMVKQTEVAGGQSITAFCQVQLPTFYKAAAPETTSIISFVIAAWRIRFMFNVNEPISSPAFFDAASIAVIREPCSDAIDSKIAR
jgi:hypothetical protein